MIAFLNSFFQYVVMLVVFAAVGVVGAFLGIQARKKKNAKEAVSEEAQNTEQ